MTSITKPLVLIFLIIILITSIFVLWMNLTPGHFQRDCCSNKVDYIKRDRFSCLLLLCVPPNPDKGINFNNLKLMFSLFDFNK